MTNSERIGYFTSGQNTAAKRWAQAELNKVMPIIRKTGNLKYKAYAEKLIGVIDGWLCINEVPTMMEKFENSPYCF